MSAQTVETVVAQISHAGLNLSLAPCGGLAVAPATRLTADLRDLIRASKPMLIEWLTPADEPQTIDPTAGWNVSMPAGTSLATVAKFRAASLALDAMQQKELTKEMP